jgi:hypothetical protein
MSKSIQDLLEPWMVKPFQFIFHAESHYENNSDYSKRMAYISFDNAIEVTIYTFMHCNTDPKGSRIYQKEELTKVKSYYKKLEVLENYIQKEKLPLKWDKNKINYYHEQRNNLYHEATLSSPDTSELDAIRQIAFWVFSTLFKIASIEELFNAFVAESEKEFPQIPEEYAKPIVSDIAPHQETALFIASILGGWNENSQGDNAIISEVTNEF